MVKITRDFTILNKKSPVELSPTGDLILLYFSPVKNGKKD